MESRRHLSFALASSLMGTTMENDARTNCFDDESKHCAQQLSTYVEMELGERKRSF